MIGLSKTSIAIEQEIDEYEGMSEDEFENSLEYGESEAEETSWEDV